MTHVKRRLDDGARVAGLCLLLVGCSTMRPIELAKVEPLKTVRIESSDGIRVVSSAPLASTGAPCVASHLDGQVDLVIADTIHFTSFRASRTLGDVADCQWTGGAFVVLTASPDARLSRPEDSTGRSAALVLVLLLLPIVALGLAGAAAGSLLGG